MDKPGRRYAQSGHAEPLHTKCCRKSLGFRQLICRDRTPLKQSRLQDFHQWCIGVFGRVDNLVVIFNEGMLVIDKPSAQSADKISPRSNRKLNMAAEIPLGIGIGIGLQLDTLASGNRTRLGTCQP